MVLRVEGRYTDHHNMTPMLISLTVVLRFVYPIDCSSEERLAMDTRECGWKPLSHPYSDPYSQVERILREQYAPRDNPDILYETIQRQLERWEQRFSQTGRYLPEVCALSQLVLSRELDARDCLDHCTYIIAKNNCNLGLHTLACQPLSRKWSYIKILLDGKVFPAMERCQVPLIDLALELNATAIEPQLYETIRIISKQLSFEKDGKTHDRMILNSIKPFFLVRRLVVRYKSHFIENIFRVMREVDTYRGQGELGKAIDERKLLPREARGYFRQLILVPCREYIDKMHKAMDASIFYGRTRDLGGARFSKAPICKETKVKFFELVRMYEVCVFLDDNNYLIDWKKQVVDLFFN